MAITSKVVTIERLSTFKDKADEAYVAQEEGKSLIETTKITKLDGIEDGAQKNNIKKVQIGAVEQDISEDGTLTLDVESVIAGDNLVTDSELSTQLEGYVKDADFDSKVKTSVGSVYRPKGSKENFEAIKSVDTPAEGDVYNATDTGANYVYVGEGQGEDESGWDKLSETVDLSDITTQLGQKADQQTVTEGLAGKADKTELDNYIKSADLQEATDEDIQNLFTPAV